jgi:predicted HTH domain antitoxin
MINGILIMAGIALVMLIFVVLPQFLQRKRERQAQTLFVGEGHMESVIIEIPPDVISAVKLPRKELDKALKIELAIHLYATGILPFGPARRLAGLSKLEFHALLGQRRIARQYEVEDYEKDLLNIEWMSEQVVMLPSESG